MHHNSILVIFIILTKFSPIFTSILDSNELNRDYSAENEETEPPIAVDFSTKSKEARTEPNFPNIVNNFWLTKKSNEPNIPSEVYVLNMKTAKPEPFIPSEIYTLNMKTAKPEPIIPSEVYVLNMKTARPEPFIPSDVNVLNMKTAKPEPFIPKLHDVSITTKIKPEGKHLTTTEPSSPTILDTRTEPKEPTTEPSLPTILDTRTEPKEPTTEPSIPTILDTRTEPKESTTEPSIPTILDTRTEPKQPTTEPSIPTILDTRTEPKEPTTEPSIPTILDTRTGPKEPTTEPSIPTILDTRTEPKQPTTEPSIPTILDTRTEPKETITEPTEPKPLKTEPTEPTILDIRTEPKETTTEPTEPTILDIRTEPKEPTTEPSIPTILDTRTEPKQPTTEPQIYFTKLTSILPSIQTTISKTTTGTSRNTDTTPTTYYDECMKRGQLCTEDSYCDETTQFKCVCDARIGYNETVSNSCQRISPCDKSFKRCGTAKCIVLSDDILTGYKCDCDVGYSLVEEKFCRPNKCQYPVMTKCNQICTDNEKHDTNFQYNPEYFCSCFDGYDLEKDKKTCTTDRTACKEKNCGNRGFCVKDKCVCKQRYTLIDGKCEIDQNWCSTNCMEQNGQCIESNGGVVCNCSAPKYRLNSNTGLCNAINFCDKTEVGGKLCNIQKALCVESISDKGYECQCPKGTQLNGEKCSDSCDITSNKLKCESLNAKCIYNSILGLSCNCNPGLYWSKSDQKCVMAQFSTKTKFQLRNPDLIQGYDKEGLSNGLNNQNSIIGDILGALTDSLKTNIDGIYGVSLINCDRLSDKNTDFNCEISIQMNSIQGLENLKQKLQKCEKIGAEEYCYLPPKTLIARKTEPIFSNLNPCNDISNACTMSSYSKCETVGGSTQYECLCPKNGFRVTETRSLGEGLRLQYCQDIDECSEGECGGNHKICINTIGSFKCYCDKGYKMNSTENCAPVCHDVNCGHGVCKETGNDGFWCKCNDGYSGEKCLTEADSPSQTAFIISLLSLAFVLLLISVIAAFCIGKFTNISKGDQNIKMKGWQVSRFQRNSSSSGGQVQSVNSRIRESEQ